MRLQLSPGRMELGQFHPGTSSNDGIENIGHTYPPSMDKLHLSMNLFNCGTNISS